MGLLDELATYDPGYEYGGLLPFRINKKTRQKELAAPAIVKDVARAISAPMRAYEGKIDTSSPEAVMEAANIAGLLGEGAVAATGLSRIPAGQVNHTVWHGSPHKFDKFDMSKIGTGEGAQAYGHGLYFAESPAVANQYAEMDLKVNGDPILRQVHTGLRNGVDKGKLSEFVQLTNGIGKNEADKLVSEAEQNASHLYKVDIPDSSLPKMLDWDKPLSEQSKEVQDAIMPMLKERSNFWLKADQRAGFNKNHSEESWFNTKYLKQTPAQLIKADIGFNNPADAAEKLKALGIPGIRYLDGNSRGSGQGSYNYVIFDDTLPKILERNGQPLGLLE